MARLTATVGEINDKDGKSIDPAKRSAGSGNSFRLVKPDFYLARVKDLKYGEYRAPYKGFPSKDKDKKWTYVKLTPGVELLNPEKTLINRQDIQVGVLSNGALTRPDGDGSKANIWTSAQYLLGALGLLKKDDHGLFMLDFDTDLIANRIIKVRTGIGGYIKGEATYEAPEMTQKLLEVNDGVEFTFEETQGLIDLWNEDNGYDLEDEIRLKPKNLVTNFFAVDLKTIEDNGFYLDEDTGAVFQTEGDYTAYLALVDQAENHEDPKF